MIDKLRDEPAKAMPNKTDACRENSRRVRAGAGAEARFRFRAGEKNSRKNRTLH
jgi:hypothetical protein